MLWLEQVLVYENLYWLSYPELPAVFHFPKAVWSGGQRTFLGVDISVCSLSFADKAILSMITDAWNNGSVF